MTITEFEAFVRHHRETHPGSRLPAFEAATPMYGSWFKLLMRRGISDAAALDEASTRMIEQPPARAADHFATLCTYAEAVMRSRGGSASADISTREGAEAASKGCDRGCGGTGLTTVYHPRPSHVDRIPATSSAYCCCSMGRWIERNHSARHPDLRKRIPDLADVIAGRSVWLAEPADVASETPY